MLQGKIDFRGILNFDVQNTKASQMCCMWEIINTNEKSFKCTAYQITDKKKTQVQKTERKSPQVNVIPFSIHSFYILQTTYKTYKRQILKQKQGFSKWILSIWNGSCQTL